MERRAIASRCIESFPRTTKLFVLEPIVAYPRRKSPYALIGNAISWEAYQLQQAQFGNPLWKALKNILFNKGLPNNVKCQLLVKHFANECSIEDGMVWRHVKRQFETSQVVIFLSVTIVQDVLAKANGNLSVGNDGIYSITEHLLQCYYWPGMDADIAAHLKFCHHCQMRQRDDPPPPALLPSLPQPTEPNHRVHSDLFGPFKTKFILCITEALTKYIQLVLLL